MIGLDSAVHAGETEFHLLTGKEGLSNSNMTFNTFYFIDSIHRINALYVMTHHPITVHYNRGISTILAGLYGATKNASVMHR